MVPKFSANWLATSSQPSSTCPTARIRETMAQHCRGAYPPCNFNRIGVRTFIQHAAHLRRPVPTTSLAAQSRQHTRTAAVQLRARPSSSAGGSGARKRATSASVTRSSVGGCQRGALSLSTSSARTPFGKFAGLEQPGGQPILDVERRLQRRQRPRLPDRRQRTFIASGDLPARSVATFDAHAVPAAARSATMPSTVAAANSRSMSAACADSALGGGSATNRAFPRNRARADQRCGQYRPGDGVVLATADSLTAAKAAHSLRVPMAN